MAQVRDPEGGRRAAPASGAADTSPRQLIHELNNLLSGLLNSVELLRRSRTESERQQAVSFIESAGTRIQALLPTLSQVLAPAPTASTDSSAASRSTSAAPANGVKRKILVADDEEMNRTLLRKILETSGHYAVMEARDGTQAIELYRANHPDLILLDIGMPGLSGAQVIERIQELDADAKVLLLSGYVSDQDAITRAPSVVGFLQKPIEVQTLLKTLDRLLQ